MVKIVRQYFFFHALHLLVDQPNLIPAPEGYSPSLEWQEQQLADFADVRQVIHMTNCRLVELMLYCVGEQALLNG